MKTCSDKEREARQSQTNLAELIENFSAISNQLYEISAGLASIAIQSRLSQNRSQNFGKQFHEISVGIASLAGQSYST